MAIVYDHIDIVNELLSRNADITTRNKYDMTPYDIAVYYNKPNIISLLKPRVFKDNIITNDDIMYKNKLVERFTCPICFANERKVVFNCGHLTCEECSSKITECGECKVYITSRTKLYM